MFFAGSHIMKITTGVVASAEKASIVVEPYSHATGTALMKVTGVERQRTALFRSGGREG